MLNVSAIVDGYLSVFPGERGLQHPAVDFVRRFSDRDVMDRQNFTGHLTASALAISRERAEVVLIKHKTLDRWLQPGGHMEVDDASPLAAAIRELREEAGIVESRLQLISPGHEPLVPMDIDSHPIPENAKKGEPAHVHHDFRYLFLVTGTEFVTDFAEVDDCRWVPVSAPRALQAFPRLLEKARAALNL